MVNGSRPHAEHQFLLMLKPELLTGRSEQHASNVFDLVERVLRQHDVRVARKRTLAGQVDMGRLVRRLYPRLWLVARWGLEFASEGARARARSACQLAANGPLEALSAAAF